MPIVSHPIIIATQSIKSQIPIEGLQSKLSDKKTLLIICFAFFFATFDFTIFIFLSDTLGTTFFAASDDGMSHKLKLVSLFAIGYIARPLGGYLFGRYGDAKGRKPALHLGLSILFLTSLAAACLPTYTQVGIIASILLISIRLVQGGAFANQAGISWVYVAESLPKRRLAFYMSWVSASAIFGAVVCGIVIAYLNHTFTAEQMMAYGWRIPFVVSGLLGFFGYFLVKRLEESSAYLICKRSAVVETKPTNQRVYFTRTHTLVLAAFLSLILASAMIMFTLLLPKLIDRQILIDSATLRFISIVGFIGLAIGKVFYGWLADKFDIERALMIGAALLCVQTFIFQYDLSYGNGTYLLPIFAILGFCSGFVSLCPTVFVHLFSTKNRLTAVNVVFNSMTVFTGAVLPFALLFVVEYVSFAPALYLLFMALCAFFISYYMYHTPQLYEFKQNQQ